MSSILYAYKVEKVELDLNNQQTAACRKHAGAARWAYNWGLRRKQDAYHTTGKSLSAIDLHRELNALKQTEVPWIYAVSKCAPQEALRNLDFAFAHFFRRTERIRQGMQHGRLGYRQCKSKKSGLGSFRMTGSSVGFSDAIQLSRLGRLRLKEQGHLPPTSPAGVKILSATVSEKAGHEKAGHWYVSVLVEQEHVVPTNSGPVVGVDLGVKTLATLSDGSAILTPRSLTQRLKKIKRLQRAVSRKQKGNQNRKKAVRSLGQQHRKAADQRTNMQHQVTTMLAKTKSVIVIEDLSVAGMLTNHYLAQAIGDAGFGEFRRQLTYTAEQLTYTAEWYSSRVVVASRWEPSSKTCSGGGRVDADLALGDRVVRCERCGLLLDRDLHAAINLTRLAGSSSDSLNACGGEGAGLGREALVKLSLMKQEPNTIYPFGVIGQVLENG